MVSIPSAAKLISTTVNEKSGTTVRKFLMPEYGKKAIATVVDYGANNPLKKKGIDSFVKIAGSDDLCATYASKALFSGDKIVLSGASNSYESDYAGDFCSRFKEMIGLFKKYPKLTAELIPNNKAPFGDEFTKAINKFQG